MWLGVGMAYVTNDGINGSNAYLKETQDGLRKTLAAGLELCLVRHCSEEGDSENECGKLDKKE